MFSFPGSHFTGMIKGAAGPLNLATRFFPTRNPRPSSSFLTSLVLRYLPDISCSFSTWRIPASSSSSPGTRPPPEGASAAKPAESVATISLVRNSEMHLIFEPGPRVRAVPAATGSKNHGNACTECHYTCHLSSPSCPRSYTCRTLADTSRPRHTPLGFTLRKMVKIVAAIDAGFPFGRQNTTRQN